MSHQVPRDKPLSNEDRKYLHARGEHALVEYIDEQYPPDEVDEGDEGEGDDYEEWKVSELQEELGRRGLDKAGKKDELIARLRASDAEAQD